MKNTSKLKKNILASVFVLTGGMLSNLSMANAYDGKITFLGKISNATCEISGGNTNGTETTNPNFSVTGKCRMGSYFRNNKFNDFE